MKKDKPFVWIKEQNAAFIKLKDAYIEKNVFIFFNPIKPNRIKIDKSDLIIGVYLLQLNN